MIAVSLALIFRGVARAAAPINPITFFEPAKPGTLNGGGPAIRIATMNGDVTLRKNNAQSSAREGGVKVAILPRRLSLSSFLLRFRFRLIFLARGNSDERESEN